MPELGRHPHQSRQDDLYPLLLALVSLLVWAIQGTPKLIRGSPASLSISLSSLCLDPRLLFISIIISMLLLFSLLVVSDSS